MEKANQIGRSLKALLASWGNAVAGTDQFQPPPYYGEDKQITLLTEKTGEIVPGACFVARVRETSDGHPYIGRAIALGAGTILAQRPAEELHVEVPPHVAYLQVADTAQASAWLAAAWEGFPSRQLVMIGITGTDGKTTTSNILLSMLRAAGYPTGLLSTTRAVIGEEEEPLALHVTTPEAPIVQRQLRRMVEAGMTHCILEATSHGLAQFRVGAIDFDIAVITNITHEHLDYHGGYEQYAAVKASLFSALSANEWSLPSANVQKIRQVKTAVLNQDDPSFELLSSIPAPYQLSYSIDQSADLQATNIRFSSAGTEFSLVINDRNGELPDTHVEMSSPLIGKFNVYNALAAAGAATAAGASTDAVRDGLQDLEPIKGRMEVIDLGQSYTVIVDFAHTPNALEQAIKATRRMTEGRLITVFGSAGKRDIMKRKLMARISSQLADLTILTAEDPRTDSLEAILEAMAEGCRQTGGIERQTFWRIPDRGKAIYFALSKAKPGDLVLVSGKGHEQSMCFGDIEYPWNDKAATLAALKALAAGEAMPDLGLPTFIT